MKASAPSANRAWLHAAFAEEERRAFELLMRARLIALVVIAAWIPVENNFPALLYYEALIAGFAGLGLVQMLLRRWGLVAVWQRYLFPLLDVGLFTLAVLLPNPLEPRVTPLQMRLRFGNELYLFLFLIASLYSYSPGVVLWTGVCAAAAWTAATFLILRLPDSFDLSRAQWAALAPEQAVSVWLDPHRVNLGLLGRAVVLLLLAAGILAAVVWRSRRLVLRQVAAERERTNLARYFSPNMVQELAHSDQPLRATRTQPVAVLFADMVGFTKMSASLTPETVILLLRQFYGRMASAVFGHGGTLDKYLGDGIMATFGTPRTGPRDATNALCCARTMTHEMHAWNAERQVRKEDPIRIGIGVHYGAVVLGDIGNEQQLEFAVLGDTVNVASRLQELTRVLDADLVVSGELVDAVHREGASDVSLVGLRSAAPQAMRGRDGLVRLWTLRRGGDETS